MWYQQKHSVSNNFVTILCIIRTEGYRRGHTSRKLYFSLWQCQYNVSDWEHPELKRCRLADL